MGKTEEKKLAERLKNRDRTAMNELYGLYSGYLFALCCRYVADRDTAKDILHDCFLKIFSSIGRFQFRGEGSLKAWMSRIVINESLKYLKKTAGNDILTSADNLPDIPDEEGVRMEPVCRNHEVCVPDGTGNIRHRLYDYNAS